MKIRTTFAAISTALILTACEDATSTIGTQHEEHSAFEEFVEHVDHHFEDAESPEVVPTSDYKTAQDVSAEHTCYTVKPTATEGWLLYTVELEEGETATDRSIFINAEGVTAKFFGAFGAEADGHALDLDEVTTEHIKAGFVFHELKAGGYGIHLSGLTVGTPVKIVIAHGGDEGGEGHEGHDH